MRAGPEQGRLALLASVNEVTDGRVLLGETVARLLEFVVPAFADVATLDTISPTGELTRVGSRVQGPGREHLERGLLQRRPVPQAPVGLPRALSSGQGQLIERMAEEHLRAIAADQADYELLRALELRSMIDVLLVARRPALCRGAIGPPGPRPRQRRAVGGRERARAAARGDVAQSGRGGSGPGPQRAPRIRQRRGRAAARHGLG
jgi:hypothetical protein